MSEFLQDLIKQSAAPSRRHLDTATLTSIEKAALAVLSDADDSEVDLIADLDSKIGDVGSNKWVPSFDDSDEELTDTPVGAELKSKVSAADALAEVEQEQGSSSDIWSLADFDSEDSEAGATVESHPAEPLETNEESTILASWVLSDDYQVADISDEEPNPVAGSVKSNEPSLGILKKESDSNLTRSDEEALADATSGPHHSAELHQLSDDSSGFESAEQQDLDITASFGSEEFMQFDSPFDLNGGLSDGESSTQAESLNSPAAVEFLSAVESADHESLATQLCRDSSYLYRILMLMSDVEISYYRFGETRISKHNCLSKIFGYFAHLDESLAGIPLKCKGVIGLLIYTVIAQFLEIYGLSQELVFEIVYLNILDSSLNYRFVQRCNLAILSTEQVRGLTESQYLNIQRILRLVEQFTKGVLR